MNVLDELAGQVVSCAEYPGNRPYDTADAVGCRALLFNANPGTVAQGGDPFVTPELILEASDPAGANFIVGLYFVWPRGSSSSVAGGAYARGCSTRVEELGGAAKIALVLHDVEKVPLDFQSGACDAWDVVRYGRPTKYSVEPFQDRTQNDYPRFVARNRVAGKRLRKITTQSYYGGMKPIPPAEPIAYVRANGGVTLTDDEIEATLDPIAGQLSTVDGERARARYLTGALALGTRGATLFELGRVR